MQPSSSLQSSATWIGIDGASTTGTDLIQDGTAQETEAGVTSYWAWYEILPAPAC